MGHEAIKQNTEKRVTEICSAPDDEEKEGAEVSYGLEDYTKQLKNTLWGSKDVIIYMLEWMDMQNLAETYVDDKL